MDATPRTAFSRDRNLFPWSRRYFLEMRMLALLVALHAAVTLPPPSQDAAEAPIRIGRTPAPSPDGKRLCFVYQGNLWTVGIEGGVATRLTANDCVDANPRWSPDGKWIAFNSDREGGAQIFLIPSQGGVARQVTFHSAPSFLCDWYPDGKGLLVNGTRNSWRQSLGRIDLESGRLTAVVKDDLNLRYASFSPDGKQIAFTRGALADLIRKGYKGAANYDIYTMPSDGSAPAKRLTDSDLNDMYPAWGADSKTVYFASEREGTLGLWRQTLGGRPTPAFREAPDAVRFVAGSRDGSVFAFECDNWIWTKTAGNEPAKRLNIICRTDDRGPRSSFITQNGNNVDSYRLSPDGKRTAFVIRGDIFVATNDKGGEAKRLSDDPQRDDSPVWTPDGKSIVFASGRRGTADIYSVDLATRESKPLTSGPAQDQSPQISPDGKWVAFMRAPQTSLWLVKLDGTGEAQIVPGPKIEQFEWSPDSRWIAFAREDVIRNVDISVVPIDENGKAGAPVNITDHPGLNYLPKWTADGLKLVFRSNRYRNRDIETINHQGRYALYQLPLVPTPDKFDIDEDTEKPEPPKDPKAKVEVKFDFKDIDRRATPLTTFLDSVGELAVSPDSKSVAFTMSVQNQPDIWVMNLEGGAPVKLGVTGFPSSLQWAPDSSRIYFTSGGQIRWVARTGQGGGAVGFTARMEIERLADYLAVFDEAWSVMHQIFYDRTFRGRDWRAIGAKYRALVPEVRIRGDFNYLMTQLWGELNSSHTGFGGGAAARPALETGFLGIFEDEAFAGPGVKIAGLMPRSAATKAESLLKVGETILEIDGRKVKAGNDADRALNDKVGRTVVLKVQGADSQVRTVKIKPQSFQEWRALMYEKWIDERREIVEKASGGRFGYLHVSAMGDSQRNRFERELFSIGMRKEGMVLDFRGNNGGDTHDSLLKILARTKHYFSMAPRTETPFPQPERAYTKPTIVLTDEFSLSDAEVFSNGYKELGLGKVVGNTTMGWIVFTSGFALLDGSFMRTPYIGCFTNDGRDMELWGVPPDVRVAYSPEDFRAGRDAMLLRGVEELLKDGRLRK